MSLYESLHKSKCLFLYLVIFLLREKPWSRPSSVKLLSWRNWSPPRPTRRCLGITVKSPAMKARGGSTLEHNQTASFCKLLHMMLLHVCLFLHLKHHMSQCGLPFVSQGERQRGVWNFCSLYDVRENSVPLSDPSRQIREILHARWNKVWHNLAGRPSRHTFIFFHYLNAAADGLSWNPTECYLNLFSWLSIWRWNLTAWWLFSGSRVLTAKLLKVLILFPLLAPTVWKWNITFQISLCFVVSYSLFYSTLLIITLTLPLICCTIFQRHPVFLPQWVLSTSCSV